ncbi:MAG: hypothetical protein ABJC09_11070 [Terriglobia bacterium]
MTRARRAVFAILTIVAMLSVSASSLSAAHTHQKDSVDRCGVCSAAHLAVDHVARVQILPAPEFQFLAPLPVETHRRENLTAPVFLIRGPPRSL